ncbi:MAG: ribulose-phosphate 3-epimerase [Clostridiales bacterium]|nr:ribulose-phosphate 3-epimerase [Clostridiales bacterium]
MIRNVKIAPSVLSADFSKMGEEIKRVENAGAEFIHLDVMDGVFVPNITFGIKMVADIRKVTNLIFDCHLMIVKPEKYIEQFVKAGADYITVHYEECKENLENVLKQIKSYGVKCGLVINPDTPVEKVENCIPLCDMVTVMSVFPGFGGQKFIPEVLGKCKKIREIIDAKGLDIELEIDGGINSTTAKLAIDAGCSVLVAGSAVFGASDIEKAVKDIRGNK